MISSMLLKLTIFTNTVEIVLAFGSLIEWCSVLDDKWVIEGHSMIKLGHGMDDDDIESLFD